jgi:hypothetical protein
VPEAAPNIFFIWLSTFVVMRIESHQLSLNNGFEHNNSLESIITVFMCFFIFAFSVQQRHCHAGLQEGFSDLIFSTVEEGVAANHLRDCDSCRPHLLPGNSYMVVFM